MQINIKRLRAATCRLQAVTVAMVLGVAFSNASAFAQDLVRVGVGVDPSYTSWWVAADKGFFAKRNLKVEITQFSGGPDLADATMAGEQDFGSSGRRPGCRVSCAPIHCGYFAPWPRRLTTSKWRR